MRHRTQRLERALVGGAAALSLSLLLAAPIAAQSPSPVSGATAPPAKLTVTTTYPSVGADPGGQASFPLFVTSPQPERVDLTVKDAPDGFTTTLRGGGSVVSSVFTGGDTPPELELQVDVPDGAAPATYAVIVVATSATESVELPVDLVVADATGGSVDLTTDFPLLRGDSAAKFQFNLNLVNGTPQEVTFGLAGAAPDGWDVVVSPSGQTQAATAVVGAGKSQNVQVTVTPARFSDPGQYPVLVTADGGSATTQAQAQLAVEITGSYSATMSTPDGRLNATATAGNATTFTVVITNTGTADLIGVKLSATPPAGWNVKFDQDTVDIAVNQAYTGTASITPAGNAVAGDYVVTMSAKNDRVSQSIAVRTTVEGSSLWAFVGLGLIALVLVGLFLVFRRYGRR